jgi:hypothetical protein
MKLLGWTAPGVAEELAVAFGPPTGPRLLVLPAWFDEGNKLRHFTVEVMRTLEKRGVASVLPDMPGCNESLAPPDKQDISSWRAAAAAAALHFGCSHVLAFRAAAMIAPDLPGWAYAPLSGKSVLRAMLRAQVLSAREAGRQDRSEELLEQGKVAGLDLAGYSLGAAMVAQMAELDLPTSSLKTIAPADLGGSGLWLRAEPDHDPMQAAALAQVIAGELGE